MTDMANAPVLYSGHPVKNLSPLELQRMAIDAELKAVIDGAVAARRILRNPTGRANHE